MNSKEVSADKDTVEVKGYEGMKMKLSIQNHPLYRTKDFRVNIIDSIEKSFALGQRRSFIPLFKLGYKGPKINLILYIDHTLIHGFYVSDVKGQNIEQIIKSEIKSNRACLINLDVGPGYKHYEMYIIKRAGVDEFLLHLSEFCTFYVVTHAKKIYAQLVMAFLDPEQKYFSESRMISAEGELHEKSQLVEKSLKDLFGDNKA